MQTKPLFIFVSDGGDGSSYPQYSLNPLLVAALQDAYDNDRMDYENGIGCDGDGFHYDTLQVPVGCTAESLGITEINGDSYDFLLPETEEE